MVDNETDMSCRFYSVCEHKTDECCNDRRKCIILAKYGTFPLSIITKMITAFEKECKELQENPKYVPLPMTSTSTPHIDKEKCPRCFVKEINKVLDNHNMPKYITYDIISPYYIFYGLCKCDDCDLEFYVFRGTYNKEEHQEKYGFDLDPKLVPNYITLPTTREKMLETMELDSPGFSQDAMSALRRRLEEPSKEIEDLEEEESVKRYCPFFDKGRCSKRHTYPNGIKCGPHCPAYLSYLECLKKEG